MEKVQHFRPHCTVYMRYSIQCDMDSEGLFKAIDSHKVPFKITNISETVQDKDVFTRDHVYGQRLCRKLVFEPIS